MLVHHSSFIEVLCLLIILLPFVGFLLSFFFFTNFVRFNAVTVSLIFFCFFCSLYLFKNFAYYESNISLVYHVWFAVDFLTLRWGFWFDSITFVMLLVVLGISSLVHIYSIDYMSEDPNFSRFMSFLSLFTFFMLILITAGNFVQMFIGWEGVGLSSFLLINFWFSRPEANAAAIKAVIVNRIGDLFITLSFLLLFSLFKTVDYLTIFLIVPYFSESFINFLGYNFNFLNLICFFLFLGAVAKSAQLPNHLWLPSAMEGPTPVSALIHAATMVTAGVFLLVRCSPLLEFTLNNNIHLIIIIIGASTAFFGSFVGLTQFDLKKVIAYSTCSQLGYMFLITGLSQYNLSMFHLTNHAVFKALLFLSAGVIIHALNNEQDMRKMQGLLFHLPFTYVAMLIASLALMGFPFLTGFYSKDFILEMVSYEQFLPISLAFILASLTAFCTAFYSMRLVYFVFNRYYKKDFSLSLHSLQFNIFFLPKFNPFSAKLYIYEAPFFMTFAQIVLVIGSIFLGYLLNDLFIGSGTTFWNQSIFFSPRHPGLYELEYTSDFFTIIPLVFTFAGVLLAMYVYEFDFRNQNFLKTLYAFKMFEFSNKKWRFDDLFHSFFTIPVLKSGYENTFHVLDRGFIEMIGPAGIVNVFYKIFFKFSSLQTGFIYHYIFLSLLTITSIFWFVLLVSILQLSFIVWGSLVLLLLLFLEGNTRREKIINTNNHVKNAEN